VASTAFRGGLSICLTLLFVSAVFGQPNKDRELNVGIVGYSDSLDVVGKQMIDYLNRTLRLPKNYRIHPEPAMLSYENAVKFEKDGALDIALLTPITWSKVRKGLSHSSTDPQAVALLLMGANRKDSHFDYVGKILYNPRAVNQNLMRGKERAKLALIPGSASAYFYPIDKFNESFPLKVGLDWPSISTYFDVRYSQKQSESLDLLFDPQDKIDLVPVYDQELYSYLESDNPTKAAASLEKVRAWLKKCTGAEVPASSVNNIVDLAYTKCTWKETARIPGDVVVVKPHPDIPDLTVQVQNALKNLDTELMKDPVKPQLTELQKALRARRIVGFCTDECKINDLYAVVDANYKRLEKSERQWGTTAFETVSNIAYDIRSQLGLHKDYEPKVAVVLSGGGASGAYEAGALIELFKAFHRFKIENPSAFNDVFKAEDLRVHAFFGTSVGSINAVAAALMQPKIEQVTASEIDAAKADKDIDAITRDLRDLWEGISSYRVLYGNSGEKGVAIWLYASYLLVNRGWALILIGLVIGQFCLHFFIVSTIGAAITEVPKRGWILSSAALAVIGLSSLHDPGIGLVVLHIAVVTAAYINLQLLIKQQKKQEVPIKVSQPWLALPAAGLIHTFILLFRFHLFHPVEIAGISLKVPALDGRTWLILFLLIIDSALLLQCGKPKTLDDLRTSLDKSQAYRYTTIVARVSGLAGVIVILPIVAVDIFYQHYALFEPEPLQNVVTEAYSKLTGSSKTGEVTADVLTSLNASNTELVITTTDFTNYQGGIVPRELYFYRTKKDLKLEVVEDRLTKRWAAMKDYPDQIIDMVMASSAIFPGFPPRPLKNITLTDAFGKSDNPRPFDLIDGGYLHNVPVQAAVQLGATHIIIVDIHPPVKPLNGGSIPVEITLGPNLLNAFDLLFDRAQTADTLAEFDQRTFRLAPMQRAIGLVDFDGEWNGFFGQRHPLMQFFEDGDTDASISKTVENEQRPGFEQISVGRLFSKAPSTP
jgi:predicted acylesterase/phospholipase RssA